VQAKTPKEARQLGLKTYYTGALCKRGGIAERRLNGDCLCDSCVSFTRKLKAHWAVKNKDKAKAWRDANPDKMALYKKEYVGKNKTVVAQRVKDWKKANPEKVLADTRKRQTAKAKSIPSWYGELDEFVAFEAYKLAKLRKVATGINWHVDHMIPLQAKEASGYHCASNLQVIPERLNCIKRNKMIYTEPHEWIRCA